jgi:hypothetical protein
VPYYRMHRDLCTTTGYDLQIYSCWNDVESLARERIEDSDCAIVTSSCPDARPASDMVLDSSRFKVFYDLDTPITLNELGKRGQVDYIPAYGLGPFDLVLSYTGGKALEELRHQLGAGRGRTSLWKCRSRCTSQGCTQGGAILSRFVLCRNLRAGSAAATGGTVSQARQTAFGPKILPGRRNVSS